MSATSSQEYGALSTSIPTSATSLPQGNSKGIDDIISHENDACLVNLNASCTELPVDLSTPPILENLVTVMNASCDQTTDRGKGVPSFDEMVDFALVEVDFDDPTTNVRGRRALAIAKPTPRGY